MGAALALQTDLPPAVRLEALLAAEGEAARRADVDALLALQDAKREVVDRLVAANPGPEVVEGLARRASENLPLLRQLVALHRGLLGANAPLYGPAGKLSRGSAPRRVTGRL
jgi:hypothetical protein